MSIKHIVSFNMKEKIVPLNKNTKALEIKLGLEALQSKISEIKFIEIGLNISESANSADIILVSEFNSMADLDIYRLHPEHIKILDIIKKYCHEMRVVDYEK